MVFGSSGDVVGAGSSLARNFNQFGYVLTTNSPATNASYATNATYPNWIWDVYYEVTVKASAFGNSGFGYPRIVTMHASPSKTGVETEPLAVTTCGVAGDAPVPTGQPDNYTVQRGKTSTTSAPGVLSNDAALANRTAVLVVGVSRGTLSLAANGSFTYAAPSGWTGDVTFQYAVRVGSAQSAPIAVTIRITK